jgi:hypothetical protein
MYRQFLKNRSTERHTLLRSKWIYIYTFRMCCPTRHLHTVLFRICEFMELGAGKDVLPVSDAPTSVQWRRGTLRAENVLVKYCVCVEGAVHQVVKPQTKPEGLSDSADIIDIPHNSRAPNCTRWLNVNWKRRTQARNQLHRPRSTFHIIDKETSDVWLVVRTSLT